MISPDVRHSFLLSSKTVFMDLAAFHVLRVGLRRGEPWTQSTEHPRARRRSPQATSAFDDTLLHNLRTYRPTAQ